MPADDLQQRLLAVVAASGSLLRSPQVDDVIPAVLRIARGLLAADGYAVWRLEAGGVWQVRSYDGISENFAHRVIRAWNDAGVPAVPFTDPLAVEDVFDHPLLIDRRPEYADEGIHSVLSIPLLIGAAATATVVVYYRKPHRFNDVEIETARALGTMAAVALTTAELYDEQRRTREHSAFLAQASAALSDSLDVETTLQTVARLAVPGVADSCAIHLIDEAGALRLVAAVHVDPMKADAMRTLADPTSPSPSRIWLQTIRTGRSTLLENIDEAALDRTLQHNDHLVRAYQAVAFTSQISVPLLARGRTIGGLTFALGPGERRYTTADLRVAEDLAHRAAIAVDNARLYQQANNANRLKDEFLGTLSHELRTPLNAILGYARMLRRGVFADPTKQLRALEILERNAHALTQIVEDVLDVSRIISGKLRLNMHELSLDAVVDDAVASIQPAADAKGVRIDANLEGGATVVGDPERLQQVIWNLLTNAVKFTPRGGTVRVQLVEQQGHACLTVADTGRGISPGFLPHLFERFRQADSRFSREHGGLGLGLAIAKEIIASHGGTIVATSDGEGMGATFTVTVPARTDAGVAGGAGIPASGDPHGVESIRNLLKGLQVLVVDDDDDARALVQTIVEEAGGSATTASSGPEALQCLDEAVPDVMVADLGMPGMDGLQLIVAIRRRTDAARDLPAIALTAYARSEDRAAALNSGYHRHLPKPIDHAQLVKAVVSVVVEATPK
jgi:signal transduction histidine kinase/ActR/RegA family two-component response regulator